MPICLIETNLAAKDVPQDLQLKFAKSIAEILSKPLDRISVTVSPGLLMCRNGTTEPTITTHIWSIGVFGKEKNQEYSSRLFDFFKCHLPVVSEKRIVLLFHPIEPHDISIRL